MTTKDRLDRIEAALKEIKEHANNWEWGRNRAKQALTDLAELRQELAWRPIETAPEMKIVLLYADTTTHEMSNYKMETGFYSTGYKAWIWGGSEVKPYMQKPTHWKPLPDTKEIEG